MSESGWGVLGCAAIAVNKVIPAMQRSERCDVVAIALARRATAPPTSRRSSASPAATARTTTLLADPDVEAVYIPLPNHLHAEWTLRAAAAGQARALREAARDSTSPRRSAMVERVPATPACC